MTAYCCLVWSEHSMRRLPLFRGRRSSGMEIRRVYSLLGIGRTRREAYERGARNTQWWVGQPPPWRGRMTGRIVRDLHFNIVPLSAVLLFDGITHDSLTFYYAHVMGETRPLPDEYRWPHPLARNRKVS